MCCSVYGSHSGVISLLHCNLKVARTCCTDAWLLFLFQILSSHLKKCNCINIHWHFVQMPCAPCNLTPDFCCVASIRCAVLKAVVALANSSPKFACVALQFLRNLYMYAHVMCTYRHFCTQCMAVLILWFSRLAWKQDVCVCAWTPCGITATVYVFLLLYLNSAILHYFHTINLSTSDMVASVKEIN